MEAFAAVVGAVVALVAVFFVVRNQIAKNAELKAHVDAKFAEMRAYADKVEAGAREYGDELWDEAKALQVKLAEVVGRISK
jgi:hypothetical protein